MADSATHRTRPRPKRRLSAPGDFRGDAPLAQTAAVAVVVIPAVGIQCAGLAPGPPPLAPYRWQAVDQRQQVGDIVTVPAVSDTLSGVPCASVST
ncbi:hypothetical protein GCM10010251_61730 [Streptomyces aurantiogriseus]|uniref:Uncharacterized protein n=1 Tax=Streptomyces aurantiogriseus TaxID=66870 RepID=A0A918KW63_9ACTN|nr:hypothetical protein GCM10010251_61730 [Streptomyces aurantiogriseus]